MFWVPPWIRERDPRATRIIICGLSIILFPIFIRRSWRVLRPKDINKVITFIFDIWIQLALALLNYIKEFMVMVGQCLWDVFVIIQQSYGFGKGWYSCEDLISQCERLTPNNQDVGTQRSTQLSRQFIYFTGLDSIINFLNYFCAKMLS